MVMVILVLMVQMWLLTATLESYLAGHHGVGAAGLLSSLALFGVCLFLYRLVLRIDRRHRACAGVRAAQRRPWQIGDVRSGSGVGAAQHVDLVKPTQHDA